MNINTVPIEYSGFYDAPLAFRVWYGDAWYYFWRGYFDNEADEFSREYTVFQVAGLRSDDPVEGWALEQFADKREVGKISLDDVDFDESRRKNIYIKTLEALIEQGS